MMTCGFHMQSLQAAKGAHRLRAQQHRTTRTLRAAATSALQASSASSHAARLASRAL